MVDLNLNFRSPETNVRAVSDNADTVLKIAGAYADGLRSEGWNNSGINIFPGQARMNEKATSVNVSIRFPPMTGTQPTAKFTVK